uniref:REJ domain-containing protein n=1 Tax=Setaria digitata TaxID=48799 RepID=A0A915Q4L5_9BILA
MTSSRRERVRFHRSSSSSLSTTADVSRSAKLILHSKSLPSSLLRNNSFDNNNLQNFKSSYFSCSSISSSNHSIIETPASAPAPSSLSLSPSSFFSTSSSSALSLFSRKSSHYQQSYPPRRSFTNSNSAPSHPKSIIKNSHTFTTLTDNHHSITPSSIICFATDQPLPAVTLVPEATVRPSLSLYVMSNSLLNWDAVGSSKSNLQQYQVSSNFNSFPFVFQL